MIDLRPRHQHAAMPVTPPAPRPALLAALLSAASLPTLAVEQDRARAAVAAGERPPLSQLLARLAPRFNGRIVEIEFDRKQGREVYEIDVLGADGRLREWTLDAATGDVLGTTTESDDDDD